MKQPARATSTQQLMSMMELMFKVGEHVRHLGDDIAAEFDAIWQQEITQGSAFKIIRR
ncbi:MAG: hypothetical protein GY802_26320 [Gammaproteobacteria bacterium]|nr:hypothetical protein [Gammaproteobacteria bacterium]